MSRVIYGKGEALGSLVQEPKKPEGNFVFETYFDVVSRYASRFGALDLLIRFVSSTYLKSERLVNYKIANFAINVFPARRKVGEDVFPVKRFRQNLTFLPVLRTYKHEKLCVCCHGLVGASRLPTFF